MTRLLLALIALLTFAAPASSQAPVGIVRPVEIRLGGVCYWSSGSGSPEGVKSGAVCDVYYRTDGSPGAVVYVKGSGSRGTPTTTGWVALGSGGGSGTVTSVGFSSSSGLFNVTGSPVTAAGTITLGWAAQSANCVVAGPTSGANAAPTCRSLIAADLPSITSAMITNGTVAFADWSDNGCASGEIPKSNGTSWECGTDAGAGTGAPTGAYYITQQADPDLTNEQALASLSTGLLKVTTGTGVLSTATAGTDYADPSALNASSLTSGTVPAARMPALTGDVTSLAGAVATTIANDVVTYGKMQNVSAASKLLGRGDSGSGDIQEITLGSGLTMTGTTLSAGGGGAGDGSVGITIDGAGSVITIGVKGYVMVPYNGTITRVTMLSTDPSVTSGSIVVDVWKDTYANYAPTDADSITASAPPTISSGVKSQDSTLTGWTTTVTAGDILGFNVDSVTSLTRVTLILTVTR